MTAIALKILNYFRIILSIVFGLITAIALLGGMLGLLSIFLPHPTAKPLIAGAIGQMLWVGTAAWAIFALLTTGDDQIRELRRLFRRETSISHCISLPVSTAVCLATVFLSPFWIFPIYLGWDQAAELLLLPNCYLKWGWTIFWFVWVFNSFIFAWALENPEKRLPKVFTVNILPLLLITVVHLLSYIG